MKKITKDFLITSIPSLLLILLMALSYIFNPEKIFAIGGGIAFLMLMHPFYLVVRLLKNDENHFFNGLFEIWLLLLPYLWLIDKYEEIVIGAIIPIAEYGFTTELWGIAYLHKRSKVINHTPGKKVIKLLMANVLPFVALNLLLLGAYNCEGMSSLVYELVYAFCFVLNLISEILFGLFGAYYYFKINSMILNDRVKASVISATMIALFAVSQYFIYPFADVDFKWFVIKYIYLFLSCAYFFVSACLKGDTK